MRDLQMIGERDMLCGMHVHVEVPDPTARVDVMTRMIPYLPLFLALSTSSPFWQGRRTGLKGYRLAAYDELPRTGVPPLFRTRAEFDDYVATLVRAGVIEDASFLWWAIRPSHSHPTLELRAPDCCTLVEDSLAIAALYRTLVRHVFGNPRCNAEIDVVAHAIAVENKWRAQRYGVTGTFATRDGAVSVADFLDRVIEQSAADAEALGCTNEIRRCRTIAAAGTSADAQLAVFEANKHAPPDEALRAVTHWIANATLQ
jgi:carboxylate-amine ligase